MYKNNFSNKNSKLYKMKFINTRNCEYKLLNNYGKLWEKKKELHVPKLNFRL
jgi:hypothetical protein